MKLILSLLVGTAILSMSSVYAGNCCGSGCDGGKKGDDKKKGEPSSGLFQY